MGKNDEPLRPFFDVRRWLRSGADDLPLTTLDRAVFMTVVSFMDTDGSNGRPTEETVAAIVGVAGRSVRRSLDRLRQAGLIEPTVDHPHTGRAQVWRLPQLFAVRLADLRQQDSLVRLSRMESKTGGSASRDESRTETTREQDRDDTRAGLPGPPTDMTDKTESDEIGNDLTVADPSLCKHEWVQLGKTGWCRRCRAKRNASDTDPIAQTGLRAPEQNTHGSAVGASEGF